MLKNNFFGKGRGGNFNNFFKYIDDIDRGWKSENTDSVAELWIQLFQFYRLYI